MEPIRVFVGCAANGEDAESQAVLEYSIRRRASAPVEITWMQLSRDPASPFYSDPATGAGWRTEKWATPFSGFRWAIPELCGFAGKAIYSDSDVIVLGDIAELWVQTFAPGKVVMAKAGGSWRICVSMFDCAAARLVLPPLAQLRGDPESHAAMIRRVTSRPEIMQAFEGEWNCLDREIAGRSIRPPATAPAIKAVHYTDMRSQPQLRHCLPRLRQAGLNHWFDGKVEPEAFPAINALFDYFLKEAAREGYTVDRYLPATPFGEYRKKSFAA